MKLKHKRLLLLFTAAFLLLLYSQSFFRTDGTNLKSQDALPASASVRPEEFSLSVSAFLSHGFLKSKEWSVNGWLNPEDERYYFFLPSGADATQLTVRYSGVSNLFIDGLAVENGAPYTSKGYILPNTPSQKIFQAATSWKEKWSAGIRKKRPDLSRPAEEPL